MTIELPTIAYTTAIPDSAKAGGKRGQPSPYLQFMRDMPAPALNGKGKDAKMQYAWFFVPADEPADTITDPDERTKAIKANANKLVNRFTSLARRIRKDSAATHDFTFRKMNDPNVTDGSGPWGLVVYRIPPGTDKGGPPAKA